MATERQAAPMAAEGGPRLVEPKSVLVKYRSGVDGSEMCRPWADVTASTLHEAAPWRTFRWHKGQKHYSGTYWSATQGGHVIYESRLELARLLFADFDPVVSGIVAQPFLLVANVDGKYRKHVPDYLLITNDGPVVVDVKPLARLNKPVVVRTFAWTRAAVESRGWRYDVSTEPPPNRLANVRFLAGYRRSEHFQGELIARMSSSDLLGMTVGEAIRSQRRWPEPLVRGALMHVLWRQRFTIDMNRPLSRDHVLENGT